jgi:soluble lytic murein transglycosylase-like protein
MDVVLNFSFIVLAIVTVVATASPVSAETFQFTAPDGAVHFTNAPTDPRYVRMGFSVGTGVGFPNLPVSAADLYVSEIRHASARHGVPEGLVSALIRVESGFNPRAVSPKGARGLMQLMPATASLLGVRNSFDARENIDGGVRHLRGLLDRFPNNLPFALAAYNAGEQAVSSYRGIPPYPETQNYVSRILALLGMGPGDASPAALASGLSPALTRTYRTEAADGTVIYTNIPPRISLRARR